jgi:hypothetical protein
LLASIQLAARSSSLTAAEADGRLPEHGLNVLAKDQRPGNVASSAPCLGTVFNPPMTKVTFVEDALMAGMALVMLAGLSMVTISTHIDTETQRAITSMSSIGGLTKAHQLIQ